MNLKVQLILPVKFLRNNFRFIEVPYVIYNLVFSLEWFLSRYIYGFTTYIEVVREKVKEL